MRYSVLEKVTEIYKNFLLYGVCYRVISLKKVAQIRRCLYQQRNGRTVSVLAIFGKLGDESARAAYAVDCFYKLFF